MFFTKKQMSVSDICLQSIPYLYPKRFLRTAYSRNRNVHSLSGLSNNFHSLKIPDQDICAIFDSQFGGIEDHMIIVHITPHFTGIFIIIVGALRIIFLKHFFCLIVGRLSFFMIRSIRSSLSAHTYTLNTFGWSFRISDAQRPRIIQGCSANSLMTSASVA